MLREVHTDREIMVNRPDIVIKNKKGENMHPDRCSNNGGQKCHARGSRNEIKCKNLCEEINKCGT